MPSKLFWLLTVVIAVSGCTSNEIIRKNAGFVENADKCDFSSKNKLENLPDDDKCRQASIEKNKDYSLAVVELDDQGWFRDSRQVEELMKLLENEGEKGLLVFVYVHGWRHNADVCDDNLCCFRETLAQMAQMDKEVAPNV